MGAPFILPPTPIPTPFSTAVGGLGNANGDASGLSVLATGSSAARFHSDRAAERISVKDFGAKGDGSTDDYSAIAAAFVRAGLVRGVVVFPPGNYALSQAFSIPSNVSVWADPGTVTILPTAGNVASPMLLSIANASNVIVRGPTFDGGGQDFSNANTVTQAFGSNNIVFESIQVQNTRGVGTLFSICSRSGVRNSRYISVGNRYKTTNNTNDAKQAVAFCCGNTLTTSAAQSSAGTTLTFASTAGVSLDQLVTGTAFAPGSRVVSFTTTTVTISRPTTSAVASGVAVLFSENRNNFVANCYFEDVGLDPISAAQQIEFTAIGNTARLIGGPFNFGLGGGVYAVNCDGVVFQGNSVDTAGGNAIDVYRCNNAVVVGNRAQKSGISGIAVASITNASIIGNISINNNQNLTSTSNANTVGQSGILLSGITGDPASDNVIVSGNVSGDTQPTKTQNYGIQQLSVATFTRLWIDQSNQITGNASADFGGTASGYTAAKIANTVNGIQQFGTSPNFGLALLPTGTGAITTAVPDSTIANGNARGLNALDLQSSRSGASQVASGQYSAVLGGRNNTASGQYGTTVGGTFSNADGGFSVVMAGYATARQTSGKVVLGSSAQLRTVGGIQSANLMLQATTSDGTTSKRLTSDAGSAGTGNIGSLPNNSVYRLRTSVMAIDVTTANAASNDTCVWDIDLIMQRGNGTATTRIVPGAGASGSSLTITQRACDSGLSSLAAPTVTADTSLGGPSVVVVGQASKTIDWVQGVWTIEAL